MKEEIISNLAGIIEYVKQGADFVKEQAPLYVQEMINYGIWTSVFETLLYFFIAIFLIWCMVKLYKAVKNDEYEDLKEYAPIFLVLGIGVIVMFVVTSISFETLIQAVVAPRVYVVEKLLSLGK